MDKQPPCVAMFGGDTLATYACHKAPTRLQDSSGRNQAVTSCLVAANITGYDIIFEKDWLDVYCMAIYPLTNT